MSIAFSTSLPPALLYRFATKAPLILRVPRFSPSRVWISRPAACVVMSSATAVPAQRWVTTDFGEIRNLTLHDVTVQPPAENELRLRVHAVGLNFADVFALLGMYQPAGNPPFTPGFETAGVVDAVGSAVDNFKIGDRVLAVSRFGGYASYINVDAALVHALPDQWSFAEGAAFPAQAFTAWYSLFVLAGLPLEKGVKPRLVTSKQKSVLIHSAAGGVGLQLVEMVKSIGGLPVCTVGSENKVQVLQDRGVPRERIIVRGKDDKDGFEKVIKEKALGGEGGLDVVVDSVMGEYFFPGYKCLNIGGRYIVMGSASIIPSGGMSLFSLKGLTNVLQVLWKLINRPKLDPVGMINQNRTVCGFNASYLFGDVELFDRALQEVFEMELPKPTVGKTFAFEKAHDALEFFQSGKSVGKIVLELD